MFALAVLPSTRVVHVRDEEHAYDLLLASSPRPTDDARRELSRRLASGGAYFVDERPDAAALWDGESRLARAPEDHPWLGEYAIVRGDVELHRGELGGLVPVHPDLSVPLTLELRTVRHATLGGA